MRSPLGNVILRLPIKESIMEYKKEHSDCEITEQGLYESLHMKHKEVRLRDVRRWIETHPWITEKSLKEDGTAWRKHILKKYREDSASTSARARGRPPKKREVTPDRTEVKRRKSSRDRRSVVSHACDKPPEKDTVRNGGWALRSNTKVIVKEMDDDSDSNSSYKTCHLIKEKVNSESNGKEQETDETEEDDEDEDDGSIDKNDDDYEPMEQNDDDDEPMEQNEAEKPVKPISKTHRKEKVGATGGSDENALSDNIRIVDQRPYVKTRAVASSSGPKKTSVNSGNSGSKVVQPKIGEGETSVNAGDSGLKAVKLKTRGGEPSVNADKLGSQAVVVLNPETGELCLHDGNSKSQVLLPISNGGEARQSGSQAILPNNGNDNGELCLHARNSESQALLPHNGNGELCLHAGNSESQALLPNNGNGELCLHAGNSESQALLPNNGNGELCLHAGNSEPQALLPNNGNGELFLHAGNSKSQALLPDNGTAELSSHAGNSGSQSQLPITNGIEPSVTAGNSQPPALLSNNGNGELSLKAGNSETQSLFPITNGGEPSVNAEHSGSQALLPNSNAEDSHQDQGEVSSPSSNSLSVLSSPSTTSQPKKNGSPVESSGDSGRMSSEVQNVQRLQSTFVGIQHQQDKYRGPNIETQNQCQNGQQQVNGNHSTSVHIIHTQNEIVSSSSRRVHSGVSALPGHSGVSALPGHSGVSALPGHSGASALPGHSGASVHPGPSSASSLPLQAARLPNPADAAVPPPPHFPEQVNMLIPSQDNQVCVQNGNQGLDLIPGPAGDVGELLNEYCNWFRTVRDFRLWVESRGELQQTVYSLEPTFRAMNRSLIRMVFPRNHVQQRRTEEGRRIANLVKIEPPEIPDVSDDE